MLQRRSTDELHARLMKTLAAGGDGQGLANTHGTMCFVLSYGSEDGHQKYWPKLSPQQKPIKLTTNLIYGPTPPMLATAGLPPDTKVLDLKRLGKCVSAGGGGGRT